MSPPLRFRTLAGRVEHAPPPIKKSRFVGVATPVTTEGEGRTFIDSERARLADARHHCWAVRLASGVVRSSDDGEPGGSAGRPILAQIEGHDLLDVAVVVTRWFGGVKLGVGGLIRAYGGTAGQALDRGEVVEVGSRVQLQFEHAYDDTGRVQAVIGARSLQVVDTAWGQRVSCTLEVDADAVEAVAVALRDATAGRVVIELGDY